MFIIGAMPCSGNAITSCDNTDMTPRQLTNARKKLELRPTEMARAMGVPYDTYKDWQSGRRSMPSVAIRCVQLLLRHPETADELAEN